MEEYGLQETWDEIKSIPFAIWKRTARLAVEKRHHERLKSMCSGTESAKGKAAFVQTILE